MEQEAFTQGPLQTLLIQLVKKDEKEKVPVALAALTLKSGRVSDFYPLCPKGIKCIGTNYLFKKVLSRDVRWGRPCGQNGSLRKTKNKNDPKTSFDRSGYYTKPNRLVVFRHETVMASRWAGLLKNLTKTYRRGGRPTLPRQGGNLDVQKMLGTEDGHRFSLTGVLVNRPGQQEKRLKARRPVHQSIGQTTRDRLLQG